MFGTSKNTSNKAAPAVAAPPLVWSPDHEPKVAELKAAIEIVGPPVKRENDRAQELSNSVEAQTARIAELELVKKQSLARWVDDPSFVDDERDSRDIEIAKCQRALLDLTNRQAALAESRKASGVDEALSDAKSAYNSAWNAEHLQRKAHHAYWAMQGLVDGLMRQYADQVAEGFREPSEKYGVRDIMNMAEDARRHSGFVDYLIRQYRAKYGEASE